MLQSVGTTRVLQGTESSRSFSLQRQPQKAKISWGLVEAALVILYTIYYIRQVRPAVMRARCNAIRAPHTTHGVRSFPFSGIWVKFVNLCFFLFVSNRFFLALAQNSKWIQQILIVLSCSLLIQNLHSSHSKSKTQKWSKTEFCFVLRFWWG